MAKAQVATAASNNPALSTLVTQARRRLLRHPGEERVHHVRRRRSYMVDDSAKVVCGKVRTANATVHVIESVLLPQK